VSSIQTNTGAMSALQTLRQVNASLTGTQNQASSGLRIGKASDNAAYWSIATTMRSDTKALSAVSDSIGLASSVTETAYSALDGVRDHLDSIKSLLVTAMGLPTAVDNIDLANSVSFYYDDSGVYQNHDEGYSKTMLAKVDDEIMQHIMAINSAVTAAGFNGVNLLDKGKDGVDLADATSATYVTGYTNGAVQTTDLSGSDYLIFNKNYATYTGAARGLEYGVLDGPIRFLATSAATGTTVSPSNGIDVFNSSIFGDVYNNVGANLVYQLESLVKVAGLTRDSVYNGFMGEFDKKIQAVVAVQSKLGSTQTRLDLADEFNSKLIDSYKSGIGRLVDADMEETSTKMMALQTQQKLAVQSLQIANQAPSVMLSLFQ
jgi:flagellin